MTLLYHIKDLERYYSQRAEIVKAVDGITIDIHQGEFLAILGPSGAGKTTLLNLLATLDTPTGGTIRFKERNIRELGDDEICELRRQEIGIVFQFYNMHPALTAIENVEYPLLIAGIKAKERRKRATEMLHDMGLDEKYHQLPAQLSGGEKQRVGIARALVTKPSVIIADEPTGDLDSENAEKIIEILLEINKQGKTIIMVTHDESLLTENMRVVQIVDGRLRENYKPRNEFQHIKVTTADSVGK